MFGTADNRIINSDTPRYMLLRGPLWAPIADPDAEPAEGSMYVSMWETFLNLRTTDRNVLIVSRVLAQTLVKGPNGDGGPSLSAAGEEDQNELDHCTRPHLMIHIGSTAR